MELARVKCTNYEGGSIMFEYLEILTRRPNLHKDILYYQDRGGEVVSHAICANHNISLLFRREKEHDDDR